MTPSLLLSLDRLISKGAAQKLHVSIYVEVLDSKILVADKAGTPWFPTNYLNGWIQPAEIEQITQFQGVGANRIFRIDWSADARTIWRAIFDRLIVDRSRGSVNDSRTLNFVGATGFGEQSEIVLERTQIPTRTGNTIEHFALALDKTFVERIMLTVAEFRKNPDLFLGQAQELQAGALGLKK